VAQLRTYNRKGSCAAKTKVDEEVIPRYDRARHPPNLTTTHGTTHVYSLGLVYEVPSTAHVLLLAFKDSAHRPLHNTHITVPQYSELNFVGVP